MKTILQHCCSRRWLGLGISLVAALAAQAQTPVTFSIDMSPEASATAVYITGTFNGWSYQPPAYALVQSNSSSIWTNTFTFTDPPGTIEQGKFNDNVSGWESIGNRSFQLPASGPLVLPLTSWNDGSEPGWPGPTNFVTLQINMSAQVFLGNFTNDNNDAVGDPNGSITVSGDFEGWDNGLPMTNNPNASGSATNIFVCVAPIAGYAPYGTINYKFRMSGGWESPASTSGNNRQADITAQYQVLPLVYYNDDSLHDLITGSPINVTFSIYCPDGTLDDSGYAFEKGTDSIYINGDWLGWPGWGVYALPGTQEMVESNTSDIYTNTFTFPYGNSIYVNYKYSFDGEDNENGFNTNHVREIRSFGPNYSMPQDAWSWTVVQPGLAPYPNPGITSTNIVEPDFGYLGIGAFSGGNLPITWLGRPWVFLQNSSDLSSGIWNTNMGTSGTQATNWSNAGGSQFFRLQKQP